MFIETIPNRTSPPATLLRESYRDEAGMRIKARVRPTPPGVTGKGKGPHLYAAADIGVAVGAVLDGPNERTVPICAISGHNKNVNLSGNHGKHPLVGFRTTALSGMVCRTVSRGLFV